MDDGERAMRARALVDFAFYAQLGLKVLAKSGEVVPLGLNKMQLLLHKRAQAQMLKRGYVRIIVPKARQVGVSTYVEARFFWRTTNSKGTWAYILTHEDPATKNLFGMAERFHKYAPRMLRPRAGTANANEMAFDALESGYKVGTAGSKATGRSGMVRLFHGSEVAFWPNALEHASGVMQSVPKGRDGQGTEIWLESSVNGMGNYFHSVCRDALTGTNDYELFFIPWFWEDGYRLPIDKKFRLDDDELEYQDTHKLDFEQMAWRRSKIAELRDPAKFTREYPATLEEAFASGIGQSFIPLNLVERARKCEDADPFGSVIFGLDTARFGFDDTALCIREGRHVHSIETKHGMDTNEIVGWVVAQAKVWRPKRIFVDLGHNPGVVDNLAALRLPVTGVTFGGRALNDTEHFNKRVEMYAELRDWLREYPVHIPDEDDLAAQLLCHKIKRYDTKGRPVLLDKDAIKKDTGISPDKADALALTFAAPVPMFAQGDSFEPGAQATSAGESFEPEDA